MKSLWIFGHQLSKKLHGFSLIDKNTDRIVMIEAKSRSSWHAYHKKRLVLIFSGMRHFAKELEAEGYAVDYRICDSFTEGIHAHIAENSPNEIIYHTPTDYKMRTLLQKWTLSQKEKSITLTPLEENLFLVTEEEWKALLPKNKPWKLDSVYKKLRVQFSVLMDGSKPTGGKWSYDAENRIPPKEGLSFTPPLVFEPDEITREVMQSVEATFSQNPGSCASFNLPVSRVDAHRLFVHFLENRLHTFGDFQDAMLEGNAYMSHSLLSSAMNIGLLDPLEIIHLAEEKYRSNQAPLAATEGFIRQILGWREYIRGVYLQKMPAYAEVNFFHHQTPLPSFYWNANTSMNCLKQSIQEVLENGYSHHIQRLMVLGNFANLIGIRPQDLAMWFNTMYTDAHDWVVLPNVLGMATYADGGTMSTKPYISTGKYIHKMSNYCKNCRYNVNEKTGDNACPFNALYWNFLMRNETHLKSNPRMGLMYQQLNKMDEAERNNILHHARALSQRLEDGSL